MAEYEQAQRRQLREEVYATKPTRSTVFFRTFLPWQFLRFLWLNIKMMKIIHRSHASH